MLPMKPLLRPAAYAVLTLLVATAGFNACGDDDDRPIVLTATRLEARDFAFDPSNLAVLDYLTISSEDRSDTLSFDITNVGAVEHTIVIDALQIDQLITVGGTAALEIPVDLGFLQFYCRLHRDRGMEGTLVIAGSSTPTPNPVE